MPTTAPERDAKLPTTDWTLIARLKSGDSSTSARALDDLCRQYHYPFYCLIRSRGLAHHDAEDALHDFLAKLLRLNAFDEMAAEKGRLRTFLGKSLDRALITRHHREKKREAREVSVDDAVRFTFDPKLELRYDREITSSKLAPDAVFDQQWCAQLLRRVLVQLEADYEEAEKLPLFHALRPVLMTGGSLRDHNVAAIAAKLSMNEPALRTALSRMLQRYRKILVHEVRDTVEHSEDVDAEIAHLMSVMGRR